jgi:hypothetical protein
MIEVPDPVATGDRLIGASCTLGGAEMRARLREWSALRDRAKAIQHLPGGRALILADDEPIAAVADLAARESACCAFYTFTLRLDGPARELQITAGAGQEPAIEVLLGLL